MSLKYSFRKLLVGAMLFGALAIGTPMRPDEIEQMLSRFSQPKIVQVLREEQVEKDEKEP